MIERSHPIARFAPARWHARLVPLALAWTLGSACQAGTAPPIDHLGFAPPSTASLPLDAAFADEHGRRSRLGDYLGERPALIVPAYYGCSNLCGIVLHSLATSLRSSGLHAGREMEILVVSISPLDTPADALSKKRNVLAGSTSDEAGGWHFLTGDGAAISELMTALGYRYAYDETERQYAHPAGVAVAAPNGRIARVLYGATFPANELQEAIAFATDARIDAPLLQSSVRKWLLCFRYDPLTGRYSFAAISAVRAAALVALLALGGYTARAWWRERRTARARGKDPSR